MPVVLEIKTKSGVTNRVQLPVEIWQRNTSWVYKNTSTEEIDTITIDPDHALPDTNTTNNVWSSEKSELEKAVILDEYLGDFVSKQISVKLAFSEDNGILVVTPEGETSIHFDSIGKDKFGADQEGGIEIQFKENKTEFTLKMEGQEFLFTKA